MLFNSAGFLFLFLPLALVISLKLRHQLLLTWITLISCVFYALLGHIWFLIPMAITVGIDYLVAILIEKESSSKHRNALLCVSLVANVGLLVIFKYSYFIAENIALASKWFGSSGQLPTWTRYLELILPAGISFYTFQTLSYIIDVWKRRCPAEKNFFKFASFVTFFPHLVAGPLTRHNQLIPQLENISRGFSPRWQSGLKLFALGLSKKVLIADQIANLINPQIASIDQAVFITSWLLLLGYTFQIYFDFSGYSEMAIGLGRLWNIELPLNFKAPYQALNPADFWRRWHITLSQWLRDYIYIPLGGNQDTHLKRDRNVMFTMLLGGLWHGASWTFALWGIYHGILIVLYNRHSQRWNRLSQFHQRNLMFFLTTIGWLFFRADNFSHLKQWGRGLLGLHGFWNPTQNHLLLLAILVLLAFAISRISKTSLEITNTERSWGAIPQVGLALITAASIILMSHSSYFLYFRF